MKMEFPQIQISLIFRESSQPTVLFPTIDLNLFKKNYSYGATGKQMDISYELSDQNPWRKFLPQTYIFLKLTV